MQSSNSFDLKASFQVLLSLNITVFKDDFELLVSWTCCFTGFFLIIEKFVSALFFSFELFKFFPDKTHVFERSFVFCFFLFVNRGFEFSSARGSRASVSDCVLTRHEYIKLNISRLDFLILVLQSSNSFELNAFFQVLLSSNITVYKDDFQFLVSGTCCPAGLFSKFDNFVSVFFFV